jgi:hypothetical protein
VKLRISLLTLLGCAVLARAAAPAAADALKAGVLTPVMAAPELGLSGTDGQRLDLARFRG